MPKKNIYAIYKGDKFIDLGTKDELAERMKIKPESIEYLTKPAYKKKVKKRKRENTGYLIAVKIGKEGDDLRD